MATTKQKQTPAEKPAESNGNEQGERTERKPVSMANRAIIEGNLGAAPIVAQVPLKSGGTRKKVTFSICSTRAFKVKAPGGAEETREDKNWVTVVTWGPLANTCEQYLAQGRRVIVDGRLEQRSYQAEDETRSRSVIEITAQQVFFRGQRPGSDQVEGEPAPDEVASE
jgi:single-strand DNA-binding protein